MYINMDTKDIVGMAPNTFLDEPVEVPVEVPIEVILCRSVVLFS